MGPSHDLLELRGPTDAGVIGGVSALVTASLVSTTGLPAARRAVVICVGTALLFLVLTVGLNLARQRRD